MHPQGCDHLAVGLAQGPIGEGRVAPDGVAAIGRDLHRAQHGHRGRLWQERRIGVPALAEDVLGPVLRLLDQGVHVAVVRNAGRIGVHGERSEPQAEGLLVAMAQLLVPEVDHLVPEQGRAHLFELLVADGGDVDAGDLRAHGRRQRPHLDEVAGLC